MYIKYCFLFTLLIVGCKKWPTTDDVSHVSELPVFTLTGGDFMVFEKSETGFFKDPGVSATSAGVELSVYSQKSVDTIKLSEVGVSFVYYYATNSDGLSSSTQRIVVVREIDVTKNDLSGTYIGTFWDQMESKVKKIDPQGLYKVEEVFGYPGAKMSGRFVDMGDNELVLINGEGDFGRYKASEGNYSRSALSWTISLIDPPYEGVDITVTWYKKDD